MLSQKGKKRNILEKDHEEGVWASCFIFMPSDLPTHLAFWFRLVLYTGRIQALLFKVMGPPLPRERHRWGCSLSDSGDGIWQERPVYGTTWQCLHFNREKR